MRTTDRPVLITDAQPSYQDQLATRKRRYGLLMGSRLALLVLAATAYSTSAWLAVGLLALSLPLPWMAVLIANDAPVRRTHDTHRLETTTAVRPIAARPHTVVDVSDEPADVDRRRADAARATNRARGT